MGATRPGRPRSEDVDRAVLEATIELICERGLEAATIEAVASRSGVSRPAIYRRHENRDALVEDAVRDLFSRAAPPPPATDDALHDVHALLASTLHMLKRTPVGDVFRAAIPHLARRPELGRLANQLGGERRTRLHAALVRCVEAGRLRDQDLDALIDGLLGAIYFRFLMTGRRLDRAYVRRLFEALA